MVQGVADLTEHDGCLSDLDLLRRAVVVGLHGGHRLVPRGEQRGVKPEELRAPLPGVGGTDGGRACLHRALDRGEIARRRRGDGGRDRVNGGDHAAGCGRCGALPSIGSTIN